jgi:hypothetical protein
MKAVQPDILVVVRFLSTQEGGREGPTPKTWFGCPFVFAGEYFDCRLLLDGVGSISPGDKVKVPIKFVRPDLILKKLQVGDRFELWERGVIAEGYIEAVRK